MRITIDTEANYVIVPNTFFDQIDKMNAIIEENGGKKLDYTQYVKDAFAKAVSAPLKRQADVVKPRKAPSSKDKK